MSILMNLKIETQQDFLLNCVHKYTDIYNGISLLALKGVVHGWEGVYYIFISIHTNKHIYMHTYTHTCLPVNVDYIIFWISVFPEFLDFHISWLAEIWKSSEIQKSGITESMYICTFVGRQLWLSVCLYQTCMSMYVCMHACIQAWMRVYMCVSMYICVYIERQTCMSLYVCKNICIHVHEIIWCKCSMTQVFQWAQVPWTCF